MQFVTRSQWGARASRYDLVYIANTRGVKVHYEGTNVPASLARPENHTQCAGRVRAIQASHLANSQEDYSDIAYNAMVCPHGYVYEGRGAHKKTGANGNQDLNKAHYAVCAMVGDSGLTSPTTAQLSGLRDAIEWLRASGGAGSEIRGHRDGYATDCPGGPLYAWVQKGAPRPGGTPTPTPTPTPPPFPGRDKFGPGANNAFVTQLGKRLVAKGFGKHYVQGPGAKWSDADRENVADFQRSRSELRGDADGLPGPLTWKILFS
ncbi:N-acetylmuramoyl-L-alanine amidase [Streptomyces sp. SID13666]|uniref:peptidoglycan-binding protein n=1 Tax=Streptomyces sp. SID13666 TaxID=2706054 RepID=UPI0013C18CF4|nr:peptidoglycan-binding protein [Streptomyces sp. SID13666]NEA53615.1 N-acetylmuramoyl-L-alanine amidase [Streptomyces sp. SID13666]